MFFCCALLKQGSCFLTFHFNDFGDFVFAEGGGDVYFQSISQRIGPSFFIWPALLQSLTFVMFVGIFTDQFAI